MEKCGNGDACKSARRGTGGKETRPKSPAKQEPFASAKNRRRNRCGRRAERGKVCFRRDLLEKRRRKGRLFSANADKGDKKGEKRAKSCGKDDARKRTGQRNGNFKRRKIEEAEFICRGRNPLGVEKKRKDDFYRKNFRLERDAGVIFFEKSLDGQGTRFFCSGGKIGRSGKEAESLSFSRRGRKIRSKGKGAGTSLVSSKRHL